jgi:uncharacterized protein (TIGR02996 family)
MADDEAFIRAIRAHPDDDLPRLVYADFLEERGDAARAEFVRVQIELARLPAGDRRRKALEARQWALLTAHRPEWTEALRPFTVGEFRRGFPDRMAVTVRDFLEHGEALLRRVPLEHVDFRLGLDEGRWDELERLAGCPQLRLLRSVSLRGNRLRPEELDVLLDSPHLGRLEALDLSRNRFRARAVTALAESTALGNLRDLDLGHNDVSGGGLAALADGKGLPMLTTLRLVSANVDPGGVEALGSRMGLPELAELDLRDNRLGVRGVRALIAASGFVGLRRIDLRGADVPPHWREALRSHFGEAVLL